MNFSLLKHNENGTVLLITMIILTIATLIGIAAMNTSHVENLIAGNDKWQKVAFHAADGGTEVGREILEENFSCPTGFHGTDPIIIDDSNGADSYSIEIEPGMATYVTPNYAHRRFWFNEVDPGCPFPTTTQRDIRIGTNDVAPHTNLAFAGITRLSTGSALQMIAGYEGKAFGAAGGGAYIATGIHAQHVGVANSRGIVRTLAIHMIGQEGTCRY